MKQLSKYESKLLTGWEDVYKQGQLTLWIMLALKDGAKYMAEIKDFISKVTHGNFAADDKSMYRSLRRYHDAELIDFTESPSPGGGPDRKVYHLTETGKKVFSVFSERNITSVFYQPHVKQLLEKEITS